MVEYSSSLPSFTCQKNEPPTGPRERAVREQTIEVKGRKLRMRSTAELNGKERKRGGGSEAMRKVKHERERKAITKTKKMGKYKLRMTGEREHSGKEKQDTDKLCCSPRIKSDTGS